MSEQERKPRGRPKKSTKKPPKFEELSKEEEEEINYQLFLFFVGFGSIVISLVKDIQARKRTDNYQI